VGWNVHINVMRLLRNTILVTLALLITAAAKPADHPLNADDVTLLLIGGGDADRLVSLIEQRGVDFKLTPELEKKFRDNGATDSVIEALKKAGQTLSATAAKAVSPTPTPSAVTTSPPAKPAPATPDLPDPSPEKILQTIQAFAAKEALFKKARDNYTFHQSNRVEQLGPDNEIVGTFQQDWDILYDDNGARIEKVTYAPPDTLKGLLITKEDYENFRSIQPFVLTTDRLPEYEVKYMGHVKVDEITAYVFSVRPKEIKKGSLYFQGVVWVDDQDLQIVKSEGKTIPEPKTKQGENLFPRFTTYREQIDGKFWFPTFTMADDTLYFAQGPIHMKEVIRYSEYKQFRSKVRILSATPVDQPTGQPKKPNN
jgi:hypothetical protein